MFLRYSLSNEVNVQEKTKSRSVTCLQWIDKDKLVYGTKDPLIKIWDVRVDREPTTVSPFEYIAM